MWMAMRFDIAYGFLFCRFFNLCSKRDDDYKNKLFSLLGYFWDIIGEKNAEHISHLHTLKKSQNMMSLFLYRDQQFRQS
jgi:hypothetical protein